MNVFVLSKDPEVKALLKISQPYGAPQVLEAALLTLLPTQRKGLSAQLHGKPWARWETKESRSSHSSEWKLEAPSLGSDRKGA